MNTATEHLRKVRAAYRRLHGLLEADERNALVLAEIAHAGAHLGELVEDLDAHLTCGGELPRQWRDAPAAPEGPMGQGTPCTAADG